MMAANRMGSAAADSQSSHVEVVQAASTRASMSTTKHALIATTGLYDRVDEKQSTERHGHHGNIDGQRKLLIANGIPDGIDRWKSHFGKARVNSVYPYPFRAASSFIISQSHALHHTMHLDWL
jgi:hypothetical protein